MKIYLAGPMAGLPNHNFPAFFAEAARLRELGHEVLNPAEINFDWDVVGRAVCMRRDIQALMTCDCIALLPGWAESKGATVEIAIARQLEMDVWISPITDKA